MNDALYHSKHGGLWIDRRDFPTIIAERERRHQLDPAMAALVRDFERDGFIILRSAASVAAVDGFQARIKTAFREGAPKVLYQRHGEQHTQKLSSPVDPLGTRVVDGFATMPEALELFASPALMAFLAAIFDSAPLLFQSLSFDQGSQQGLHQDTAYVVVDQPLQFAACWIALQDVVPGSGELRYIPGSHRYPDYDFGSGKNWNAKQHGTFAHQKWSKWIYDEAARLGLSVQSFLPKKGDMLIWHADLAHGGAAVTDKSLTRQSLVGHFCPLGARPFYFDHDPWRDAIKCYKGLSYASEHYDLAPLHTMIRKTRGKVQRALRRLTSPSSK